jgi:dihydrofolate synthase/folylpolyglutamate synthase
MISAAHLAERIAQLRPHVAALLRLVPAAGQPTTFELTTALALTYFAAAGCTVAVVEVGLGGRLDATNATDPHVSIISPISHDHTRELGASLRQIASEKAGVLRPGRIAIVARQEAGVARVIHKAARTIAAVHREVAPLSAGGASLRSGPARNTSAAERGAGDSRVARARRARRALSRARDPARHATLHWPGRFEVVPGQPPIVVDGAHNDGSAEALALTIHSERRRPVRLIIGLMRDKDARAVAGALAPIASAVYVTRPDSPRAAEPATIARLFRRVPVRTFDDLASALHAARADARSGETICVTGPLALVGQARTLLGLPVPERLWD